MAVGEGSIWVLDGNGSVRRVDPVSSRSIEINGVAKDPSAIAIGEGAVWVADRAGRAIHEIDPASNQVVSSFPLTTDFVFDVVAGEGAVWSATRRGILRLDPASKQFEQIAELGPDKNAYMAVANGIIWYADDFGLLVRFDPRTNVTERHQLDKALRGIAVFGDSAWGAACGTPGTVYRVDARTGEVLATISAGGAVCPYSSFVKGNRISVAAGTEGVWVTDAPNGTVSRIQTATNQVETPINVGDTPTAVAVGLGSVWVTVNGEESPSPSTS